MQMKLQSMNARKQYLALMTSVIGFGKKTPKNGKMKKNGNKIPGKIF